MSKARIRSIKPEFWTDAKVARLPKSTALFFIALWNFADDQGIIEDDSRTLSLRVPIYRSQDIQKMLNALWQEGLVMRSPIDGLVLVSGWKHQKIDKPRDGKYKDREINWLTWSDSTKGIEPSSIIRRKDRIGKDRIGSGSDQVTPGSQATAAVSENKPKLQAITSPTWEAYSSAYLGRYKTEPVRNAAVNSKISQFVKRLGEGEAPLVAAFYVSHNAQFYVRAMHAVGPMLADAEKLRTEWATNQRMTTKRAQHTENEDFYADQLRRIAAGEL